MSSSTPNREVCNFVSTSCSTSTLDGCDFPSGVPTASPKVPLVLALHDVSPAFEGRDWRALEALCDEKDELARGGRGTLAESTGGLDPPFSFPTGCSEAVAIGGVETAVESGCVTDDSGLGNLPTLPVPMFSDEPCGSSVIGGSE